MFDVSFEEVAQQHQSVCQSVGDEQRQESRDHKSSATHNESLEHEIRPLLRHEPWYIAKPVRKMRSGLCLPAWRFLIIVTW